MTFQIVSSHRRVYVGIIPNQHNRRIIIAYCDPKRFPKAVLISPGDVVISRMGEPGKVGLNGSELSLIHSDVVIKCTPKNRAAASGGQGAGPVDNKFLYHWLRNSEPLMKSLIRGGVIPRINLEDLKTMVKNVIYIEKITKNTKATNHPSLKFFK